MKDGRQRKEGRKERRWMKENEERNVIRKTKEGRKEGRGMKEDEERNEGRKTKEIKEGT